MRAIYAWLVVSEEEPWVKAIEEIPLSIMLLGDEHAFTFTAIEGPQLVMVNGQSRCFQQYESPSWDSDELRTLLLVNGWASVELTGFLQVDQAIIEAYLENLGEWVRALPSPTKG